MRVYLNALFATLAFVLLMILALMIGIHDQYKLIHKEMTAADRIQLQCQMSYISARDVNDCFVRHSLKRLRDDDLLMDGARH